MCTEEGNTNKSCYLPPDKCLSFLNVPSHTGYLVRIVATPCKHPRLCDDLDLSIAGYCLPNQGRLFCLAKPYFDRTWAYNIFGLASQHLQYFSLFPEILIKSLVVFHSDILIVEWKQKFVRTSTCLGNTRRSVATFLSLVTSSSITIFIVAWSTEYILWGVG